MLGGVKGWAGKGLATREGGQGWGVKGWAGKGGPQTSQPRCSVSAYLANWKGWGGRAQAR